LGACGRDASGTGKRIGARTLDKAAPAALGVDLAEPLFLDALVDDACRSQE